MVMLLPDPKIVIDSEPMTMEEQEKRKLSIKMPVKE